MNSSLSMARFPTQSESESSRQVSLRRMYQLSSHNNIFSSIISHTSYTISKARELLDCCFISYRYKNVRDLFLVSCPGLAVLPPAPHNISPCSMNNHDHEEDEIKPGKWASIKRMNVSCQLNLYAPSNRRIAYLKPVISPQAIEKNISGT